MNRSTSVRVYDALRRAVEAGADAEQLADVLVETWQSIDEALRPVIGRLGVTALYQRSMTLSVRAHPWLSGSHNFDLSIMDLDALRSSVSAQNPTDAANAGNDMLGTFNDLLSSLVGTSLADRLLRSVGEPAARPSPDTGRAP